MQARIVGDEKKTHVDIIKYGREDENESMCETKNTFASTVAGVLSAVMPRVALFFFGKRTFFKY